MIEVTFRSFYQICTEKGLAVVNTRQFDIKNPVDAEGSAPFSLDEYVINPMQL